MSQLSGAFSIEIDLDRIADRVLARLHAADDNTTPAGSADYQRGEPDANPPADSDPAGYPLGRSARGRGQESSR